MKQLDPIKKTISGVDFYITPFPALKAANLSGEIFSLIGPLISGFVPVIQTVRANPDMEPVEAVSKMDMADLMPGIVDAMQHMSGDRIEGLLKKLLIMNQNVACEYDYEGEDGEIHHVKGRLNGDMLNEIFCQDVYGMYRLAGEVIAINYGSFFENMTTRFGRGGQKLKVKMVD